ncbi:hypothetical protein LBMAG56_17680 [Verrucomicrobiota bacterium]|nr:hypothetical protein LBMAG56_17680 [Verrucomicrobiota bacterium]
MRTTLNLDDTLYRRAKIRAAETGRTVSDLVAEGLNLLLAGNPRAVKSPRRVPLPLITGGRPARPGKGMTPEKTAALLLAHEATWARTKT